MSLEIRTITVAIGCSDGLVRQAQLTDKQAKKVLGYVRQIQGKGNLQLHSQPIARVDLVGGSSRVAPAPAAAEPNEVIDVESEKVVGTGLPGDPLRLTDGGQS